MIVYLLYSLFASLLGLITNVLFDKVIMDNAQNVHDKMNHTVLNMRQGWFEKNFNIDINFFLSYDMRRIDQIINLEIQNTIEATFFVFGGLVIINFIYRGTILVINVIALAYIFYIMRLYFKTSQNIIMFISENTQTFQGICNLTIEEIFDYRVIGNEKMLEILFQKRSNEMQRAMTHLGFFCKRWLGVRQGYVNTLLIMTGYFTPYIIAVFFDNTISLTFFEISLAISWSLKLVGYLNTMTNRYINIYDRIISYARMEYFMNRARLERTDAEKFDPELEKINVIAKLNKIQLTLAKKKILQNIDLKVMKGDCIGVYGRTGSGKHSLSSLFMRIYDRDGEKYHLNRKRSNLKKVKTSAQNGKSSKKKSVKFNKMVEIQSMNQSGLNKSTSQRSIAGLDLRESELQIFGVSSSKINHRDHRNKIHHLDAHPILFSGRFRENIDPEFQFTDKEIMSVMKYLDGLDVLDQYFIGQGTTPIVSLKNINSSNPGSSRSIDRKYGNNASNDSEEDHSPPKASAEQRYDTVVNTQTDAQYLDTGVNNLMTEMEQPEGELFGTENERSAPRKQRDVPVNNRFKNKFVKAELKQAPLGDDDFELKLKKSNELDKSVKGSSLSGYSNIPQSQISYPKQSTTISQINRKVALEVNDKDHSRSIPSPKPLGIGTKNLGFADNRLINIDQGIYLEKTQSNHFKVEDSQEKYSKQFKNKSYNIDPFKQKPSRSERHLFKAFLNHTVTLKDCLQVPIPLVKFTKAVKALIHQPYILFIDKDALEFSPARNLDHMIGKYLCSTTMEKSTVFFIFTSKFESVCLMDRIILMDEGSIVHSAKIQDYLNKWEEDHKKIESASPANGGEGARNQTRVEMETKLLKKIRKGLQHIDEVGKQYYIAELAATDDKDLKMNSEWNNGKQLGLWSKK